MLTKLKPFFIIIIEVKNVNIKLKASTVSDCQKLGPCSLTCGPGVRLQTIGNTVTKIPCQKKECEVYSEWVWGKCSVTCGRGTRTARRRCLSGKCMQKLVHSDICMGNYPCPLYGPWVHAALLAVLAWELGQEVVGKNRAMNVWKQSDPAKPLLVRTLKSKGVLIIFWL